MERVVHAAVQPWVDECAALTQPAHVQWCDGSEAEYQRLLQEALASGVLLPVNATAHPGCFLHRSDPRDTARAEQSTYICTPTQDEAGPTNNWMAPEAAYQRLRALFAGSMRGRTLYVVPFLMGPPGSPLANVGVELTDSLYVVLNMRLMTRMGQVALHELGSSDQFTPTPNNPGHKPLVWGFTRCLHSMGALDPQQRYICHFPHDNAIWSYGSGYGGNALLGKKCLALRIGSYLGRRQGWLAEHMLLMGITDPAGRPPRPASRSALSLAVARDPSARIPRPQAEGMAVATTGHTVYLTGAFPSACGKTNLAMLTPPEPFRNAGWRVTTLGDDIAWMAPTADGRLHAVNPEAGYFGVVPGTNRTTNPIAMEILAHDTIFTNVARLPDGRLWWEGRDGPVPAQCEDWTGQPWTPQSGRKAAHPNSRFTAPLSHHPSLDPRWNDPAGVPVSAMLFGGRRSQTIPLIVEAFDWTHGVFLAATLSSETTAAAMGQVGVVRRDPMAMLPFCGYHVGDYFAHWLSVGQRLTGATRIFFVNWFRTDAQGRFLWPGFGDNMRLLKWIVDRCAGRVEAVRTPLGWMPRPDDVDLSGWENGRARFEQAQAIDADGWRREAQERLEWLTHLGPRVPRALLAQAQVLRQQFA